MIYFDYNATAPLTNAARRAWLEASEKYIGNPSSPHRIGSRAEAALNEARRQLAGFLSCDPLEIVWTSGATEAANMVLNHVARKTKPAREVWISAIEHPCVLEAARHFAGEAVRSVPVHRSGVVNLDWLASELAVRRPALIAVMAVNNETGVIQPWRQVLELCRRYDVPFLCDATQWMGKLPSGELAHCDWIIGSGHKFGGPKGVGFLKCPGGLNIEPLLVGGKQEEGRRAGTENVPAVLSMIAALQERETQLAAESSTRRMQWRTAFEHGLKGKLSGLTIVGLESERVWNTATLVMPPIDCRQRWVVKLDRLGFAVSTGSACASGREQPSHVLAAMSYTAEEAGRALRFSSGWETTEEDWSALTEAIVKAHRALLTTSAK